MPILSKEEAQALLKKVIAFSKADAIEVNLYGSDGGNIRYARNAVSTSGGISTTGLVVQSSYGKKVGTATINEFDDASLEKAVRRSEELAHLAPENPEFMPNLGPQQYQESKMYVPATAAINPKLRADAVAKSLEVATQNNLVAAGFWENATRFSAMMNSNGLFAYNTGTDVSFNVTLRTQDGKGSGYASKGYNDINKLDVAAATRIAAQKAANSSSAKALEPGKYTVILEPAAAIVLLENIFFNMDARSADEGRSFLSKAGGKTKLGEKLVDERVNIYSDPLNPDMPTSTWSGDGRPQEKIKWIENGAIKNLYYSRYWAKEKNAKSVPFPDSIIVEGGSASLEDLIKGTEKGILVTRLWYIREVDPQTLLYTGLTRDGTFYIENGQIKYPIKNFRFNESPIIMLNNLEELGKPERTVSGESGIQALIPPMKVRDFTFTSLSDAV
ncbi:Predicted Zn-dependent protease or its inactivated homolog [Filimonas lacunae]|uniref:Predicted Zn-dependent protease or its inactivated homolog n=1 Tax=Filimonas lacunae TaxID=477680 RepID=A0A173MPY9_9BACT|nr:TldD/PmbA family protein [Filimonas lacunae]BAV09510.1 TldE/PmbA family protein, Actinobacterial subgroup [Filimonas lacunae]SIS74427.1 Predicted Zn-dependent protease or its inactivated homolog [Filimonas lacunae]